MATRRRLLSDRPGLCRIVNREREVDGLRCSAEATSGSIYNARMLAESQLEFAILQGDVLYAAYAGSGRWTDRPFTDLRSVLPLHPEIVTLVVDGTLGIERLEDLLGRRINGGHPGSGSRSSFETMLAIFDVDADDFEQVTDLRSGALPDAICNGRIAAFVEVVGHPSALVRTVRQRCGAQILPLTGPQIDRMLGELPYLQHLDIPGDLYGLPADIPSFGSHAMLATRADVGDDVVYLLTSLLLAGLDEIRKLHPTLRELDPRDIAADNLAVPLHPGAERAYREAGLLE
ncbi:MAG: TAXI family TRAP transporter solute-binding subunit [Geminicoccaceae bacterium]